MKCLNQMMTAMDILMEQTIGEKQLKLELSENLTTAQLQRKHQVQLLCCKIGLSMF